MRWCVGRSWRPRVAATVLILVIAGSVAPGGGPAGPESGEPADATDPTARPAQDPDPRGPGAWHDLFDGESFAGWRGLGQETIPEGHWIVEDGTIRKVASGDVPTAPDGQPLEGGDIMTVETYGDFEVTLEWRVAPGANSGIKYNVSEEMSVAFEPVTAALGFEYQILDDDLHPDAANGPSRTAAGLYDLMAPGPAKALRPVGEFNEARLVFVGNHGEHWLNGVKVLEFDLDAEEFGTALAASKYAPIDGFADRRTGHIVLQDHGDDVWFRNIRIREFPTDPGADAVEVGADTGAQDPATEEDR